MSFILDALRKSETERQRQQVPGLADAGYRPPARRRTFWLPLLVVVMAANLVFLGVVVLRPDPAPPQPGPAASPAPVAVIGEPPPPTVPPAPRASDEPSYAAIADLPALEPAVEPVQVQATPAAALPPDPAPTPAPGGIVDDLPSAEQLMASGVLATRAMHLDIHVFSTIPAERFVFINMRKYTEGAQLTEGPRVEEITPQGVVLSEANQRFLLTRD
jgi:general secretion pathway protein B